MEGTRCLAWMAAIGKRWVGGVVGGGTSVLSFGIGTVFLHISSVDLSIIFGTSCPT